MKQMFDELSSEISSLCLVDSTLPTPCDSKRSGRKGESRYFGTPSPGTGDKSYGLT